MPAATKCNTRPQAACACYLLATHTSAGRHKVGGEVSILASNHPLRRWRLLLPTEKLALLLKLLMLLLLLLLLQEAGCQQQGIHLSPEALHLPALGLQLQLPAPRPPPTFSEVHAPGSSANTASASTLSVDEARVRLRIHSAALVATLVVHTNASTMVQNNRTTSHQALLQKRLFLCTSAHPNVSAERN
jgi:hypothetical protein